MLRNGAYGFTRFGPETAAQFTIDANNTSLSAILDALRGAQNVAIRNVAVRLEIDITG
jgi:hypothetical protein